MVVGGYGPPTTIRLLVVGLWMLGVCESPKRAYGLCEVY